MNICLCGAGAGYQHYADCPYPMYRCGRREEQRWREARAKLTGGPVPAEVLPAVELDDTERTRDDE